MRYAIGMNWLLLAFSLEVGAIRGPTIPFDIASYVQTNAIVTLLDHLEIGGTLRSYQEPIPSSYAWDPFRMDYTVSAVVRFGSLSFGVERMCYHPVSSVSIYQWQTGGFERMFIRVSTIR